MSRWVPRCIASRIRPSSSGGDDEATARSYVDARVTGPDNGSVYRIAGYYDDELARDADGWKITRRRFTMVDLRSGTTDEPGS
jgi:hypothetical protein